MDKLKIGIVNISEGAGAGFFTGCLACYLANTMKHRPAVAELEGGGLFDRFGMDKRFAGRSWFRFYQAMEEKHAVRRMKNLDEGINWILRGPGEEAIRLTFEQKVRLSEQAVGDIVLCDLSGREETDYEIISVMDQIIVLIDPLPSAMMKGYQKLCKIRAMEESGKEHIYVINKMNRGVNKHQMLDFLDLSQAVFLPHIDAESIYTAEYNCKVPYSLREVKKAMQEPMNTIVTSLFR